MPQTDLSRYNNAWYSPGAPAIKRLLWYFTNVLFFKNGWNPLNGPKVALLRLFGAKVGRGVRIKPNVNIKHPWLLQIGSHCWIGEAVWIDNLARVTLGNSVCLSQGAMLLTGNHDYGKPTFDLTVGAIVLEDGVWIGARAIVGPGVTCRSHAVLTAGSLTSQNLEAYRIYRGNPAVLVKERRMTE
ncbi:MAG: colanic acid biosynthesis acetyltransferase WcaF [Ferruginibacter sp.]|nr:colanic acid biosynthesis acetyltransferase WcaF [Cytophagales bacterium]